MTHLSFEMPYPSQRMPVMAEAVVATSQPLAAQAGLQMLARGGNAVDAALAAAMALTVVEPTGCGLGSDAFAIVWDGKDLHGLNASGRAPAAWTPEFFSSHDAMPERGWNSVTVPGAVSAWVDLSERFGALPFGDLAEAAIRYARDGFIVSPYIAKGWAEARDQLSGQPGFPGCFLPGGRAPTAGERFRSRAHAASLEQIVESKGTAFYSGALAGRIASHARECGGALRESDLAEHANDWCGTISQGYRGYRLHEIPPNGQGLAALMALGMLQYRDVASYPVDSADSLHLQIEAMKLAFADVYRYVGDPAHMTMRVSDLLDPGYLKDRASLIDLNRALHPAHGVPRNGGTVYVTAADANGMMVSFIQSNYMGFGSGVVVPDTGISLQNRGAGFTLEAGHPNQVGPRKRPFQTIIPAFLTREDGTPVMSFGVMGGPMQAQGHLQMVVRMVDYHQNPQAASDAPRWRVVSGMTVAVETSFDAATRSELEARGHRIVVEQSKGTFAFGGAQLIHRLEAGGYVAGSDHRKDGHAVGL